MLISFFRNLGSFEEMPEHLQFNEYIRKGYRRLSTWRGCLASIFFIHNETANLVTHVPMAIYTLVYWESFWPWDNLSGRVYLQGLGICHTLAMLVPWIPSLFYHLFMCHQSGEKTYDTLLAVDVLGIWVTECLGSLTNISAAIWTLPEGLQGALMGFFSIMAFVGLVKSVRADSPRGRVLCFAPLLIGRVTSIALRLSPWGGGPLHNLHHILLQDVSSIVGGLIGVAKIPERWAGGKCDYWFNSHNIMHILVIFAVHHMNQAANHDVNWIIESISQRQSQG